MKTLADTQVAVRHEDLNSPSKLRAFGNIKLKALKVVKSIAIAVGCITAGVIAGTEAQAETVHKTFSYGDRGSGIAILQSKLGGIAVDGIFGPETLRKLKSYQAANRLLVNGIATPETLVSLGLHNLSQRPLQYGKLKLVNDTQYEAIVFLYAPGETKYSRYVYIPPCHERKMRATYSNGWQVSIDRKDKASLGDLTGGNFKFHVSSLPVESESPRCTRTRTPSERTSTSGLQLVQYMSSGENKVANNDRKLWQIFGVIGSNIAGHGDEIDNILNFSRRGVAVATNNLGIALGGAQEFFNSSGKIIIQSAEDVSNLLFHKKAISQEQMKATKALLEQTHTTDISPEELAKFVKNQFDESQDKGKVLQKIKNYLDDCYPNMNPEILAGYLELMFQAEVYKLKADGWRFKDAGLKATLVQLVFPRTEIRDGKRVSVTTGWVCVRWDYHSLPPAYLISYHP
jgi:peptidoglycan hydrolase-like protein with peptidoglycan-binding domain